MTNLQNIIKQYRKVHNLTMEEFATRCGLTKGYISLLEKGQRSDGRELKSPSFQTLEKLAYGMQCTTDELVSQITATSGNRVTADETIKIPVLGTVRAGGPITAMQNIIGYEEITPELARTGEFFALRVKGDSMMPRICEDDIVIVKQQPDLESGAIGVILIGNEEATIKRVVKSDNGVALVPLNNAYAPLLYSKKEVRDLPVTIIGQVIELRAKL